MEAEIQQHVGEHYEDLLSQAAGIDTLEHSLAAIQARTQVINSAVVRSHCRMSIRIYLNVQLYSMFDFCSLGNINRILIAFLEQTLQAGVERVCARIVEPYQRLEKHTLMLARLQSSCELLRRLIRCLAVTKRLTQQLGNCPRDLAKAATSISELGKQDNIVNKYKWLVDSF